MDLSGKSNVRDLLLIVAAVVSMFAIFKGYDIFETLVFNPPRWPAADLDDDAWSAAYATYVAYERSPIETLLYFLSRFVAIASGPWLAIHVLRREMRS